jgi:hypothetical protein
MKERWGPALLAALLLIGGLELFFRFAAVGLVKVLALGLVVLGIAFLRWVPWRRQHLPWKGLVVVAFAGYLVAATTRFPGLVKDPIPGDWFEIAAFAAKGALTLVASSLLVAWAASALHRARSSRSFHRARA